jgi:hypothetical protein
LFSRDTQNTLGRLAIDCQSILAQKIDNVVADFAAFCPVRNIEDAGTEETQELNDNFWTRGSAWSRRAAFEEL